MTVDSLLQQLCEVGASFYERGYAYGSTGNLSVRLNDRIWITPTGKSLKSLTPEQLSSVDLSGNGLNEIRASKELPFHQAIYRKRAEIAAVVHLHSPWATALACLEEIDPARPVPPLTPYFFMRVAPLAVLPYYRPGSPELATAVAEAAPSHNCMLLRNHGLICAGRTIDEATDRAEELEQTARLHFTLRGERLRLLTGDEIEDLRRGFASP
jgi:ribulose-5-phosphate 4-epimerase/fuculose-1-phosphate aldolase